MITIIGCLVAGGFIAYGNRSDIVAGLIIGVVVGGLVEFGSNKMAKPQRLICWSEAQGLQKVIAMPARFCTPKFKL